jgi:ribosomal protein L11 methyltransferase
VTSGATYKVRICVPREGREAFFERLWARWGSEGLQGIHEGTLLSEQAVERGLETDSWTVDSAEAPRERDWVGGQATMEAELYFSDEPSAARAAEALGGEVEAVPVQDWDAKWKASYTGAVVPPFWRVLPPWSEVEGEPGEHVIRLNPGAGFGTGTHETTQLCLEALGHADVRGRRVLDFGSGSGILAIGAALLGAATVDAVEIDPLAVENAEANAELSGVRMGIRFLPELVEGTYDVVLANILRPVLLQFAPELARRLAPGGTLILSGLIEPDVEEVASRYSGLLGGGRPVGRGRGEWRALLWDPSQRA